MKKLINVLALSMAFMMFLQMAPALAGEEPPKVEWTAGPKAVNVASDLAKLNLPEKYLFANGADTKKLMEYMGNPPTNTEVGMVVPNDENKEWFVVFEYDPLGYVADDDADSLDGEAILESIKEGTEEANAERKDQGIPALNIVGWDEKPHYDSKSHNLVWSILAESEGEQVVNYNTRILGRFGITSVTLVADPKDIKEIKPELEKIISGYTYAEGKKYTDYLPGKDKVAEVGLAALVAGGVGAAATKAGFFAKFLLLFKKFWIVLAAVIGFLYNKAKKLFEKKSEDNLPE